MESEDVKKQCGAVFATYGLDNSSKAVQSLIFRTTPYFLRIFGPVTYDNIRGYREVGFIPINTGLFEFYC
jgi:hypothetical protein